MTHFNDLTKADKAKRATTQLHLEVQTVDYSLNKYWKAFNDSPMDGAPEQDLISQFVEQVSAPYAAWLEHFETQRPDSQTRNNTHWNQFLLILEPETLAAIVIAEMINTLLSSEVLTEDSGFKGGQAQYTFQKMSKRIGKKISKIISYRLAKESFKEDWKRQSHFLKNWEPKRCDAFAKKFDGATNWTGRQIEDIGNHCLHLASLSKVISLEGRKIKTNSKRHKQENIIHFSDEVMEVLRDKHALEKLMHIVYRPMIVPPVDHTLELPGGLLSLDLRKPTVDGRSKPAQADLDALNAMQGTEWAVHSQVLEVMDIMYKNNYGECNLPPMDLDKVSFPEINPELPPEEIAKLKGERADIWAAWYKTEQKRVQMNVRLTLAKQMRTLSFFYHSYTMDFRGRAYAVCSMLSPQSGDFDRGLIKFATPVQQTEDGRYWQKVALANLMDGAEGWDGEASDKATFDDRVAWVDRNHDLLLAVAANPLDMRSLWTDNKSTKKNPSFQRLASIFDYEETALHGTTSYPVQLDGACNGSQHWSAIRKDPTIATLTNVMPVDKPQDLYQFVADVSTKEMKRQVAEGDDDSNWSGRFLEHWDGKLGRKVVKRATMCDAYGITKHGVRKYAREEGHLNWVTETMGKEHLSAAVNQLTELIWLGLDGALVESNEGKEYVRLLSDLCSGNDKAMEWSTTTGFRVVHWYPDYIMRTSQSTLYNKKFRVETSFGQVSDMLDGKAAYTGIAPNFIHSHDASHMRLVINEMADAGITQLSMIHDSFGCPAPQVSIMRQCIKDQFIHVHQSNQLDLLRSDVEQLIGCEVPESPPVGTLDISCVARAEYIFG